jgi:NRPS condensation-like uncharacterized protein
MHYLFRDFNDRMVHVELSYDFEIDVEVLKTVLICFFEKAPVLHSSFTDNHIHPYWTVMDYDINDVVEVKRVADGEVSALADEFLTQCIPPENHIQMKVLVLLHGGKTTLCIVENHMCMDGGDLKYFLKALCKNYNDYLENKISPIDLRTGTRAYESGYEDFSKAQRKMAENLYKNINSKDDHAFPLSKSEKTDKSFIARRKLSTEMFDKIKAAARRTAQPLTICCLRRIFTACMSLQALIKAKAFPFPAQLICAATSRIRKIRA